MDKKYSFANVTVRNYNNKFERELSEEFKATQNQFANSKSQFYIYLAELGLEVHKKRKLKINESNVEANVDFEEVEELLDELIEFLKSEREVTLKYFKVLLQIESAVLGVLVDIAEGTEVDSEEVERGLYDNIPERFLRILKQSKGRS